MGYIKKLKNNELVGGTDKTTIYPVTSTKAVFEEVSENNFQSQESINEDRLERIETLEAHDENHEGRVSTLEAHDSDHENRVQELESVVPNTIKSISINGGTEHTVDETGNVDLTIYTVNPDDPDIPAMADLVEKNRDDIADIKEEIGTDTTQNTLSGRITKLETLVGDNEQGSVNQRIEDAVNALDVPTATVTDSTGHVSVTLGETDGKINSLAVSTEDIASAEALNTLDVYVHNIEGGNIRVKTSVPTNPDTDAPANTVYRLAGTTTYSDYMWNGTTMVKMAEYNVDTLESQFGYYKWETASNTISITTSNQVAGSPIGSYNLTTGGSFKIKMSNKATGACTLNMNNKGAKTLLYNGVAISADNTWEAGEVVEVYYDGSVYQASNVQGDGGLPLVKVNEINTDNILDYSTMKQGYNSNTGTTAIGGVGTYLWNRIEVAHFPVGTTFYLRNQNLSVPTKGLRFVVAATSGGSKVDADSSTTDNLKQFTKTSETTAYFNITTYISDGKVGVFASVPTVWHDYMQISSNYVKKATDYLESDDQDAIAFKRDLTDFVVAEEGDVRFSQKTLIGANLLNYAARTTDQYNFRASSTGTDRYGYDWARIDVSKFPTGTTFYIYNTNLGVPGNGLRYVIAGDSSGSIVNADTPSGEKLKSFTKTSASTVYYNLTLYQNDGKVGIFTSAPNVWEDYTVHSFIAEKEEGNYDSRVILANDDIFNESENASSVSGTVTVSNSDYIVVFGSSYGVSNIIGGTYGKHWAEICSLFSDYVYQNLSVSGSSKMTNLTSLRTGAFSPRNSRFAMVVNNENWDTSINEAYLMRATDNFCKACESLGLTPIVGTSHNTHVEVGSSQKQYAANHNYIFMDASIYFTYFRRAILGTFNDGGHLGARCIPTVAYAYMDAIKGIEKPIQSIKVFRIRNSVNTASLDNLVFNDNIERAHLFKEIYSGTYSNEYNTLASGGSVNFTNYALISAVLPVIRKDIETITLSFTTSSSVSVYRKSIMASPYPTSTTKYARFFASEEAEWPSVNDTYSYNNVTYTIVQVVTDGYGEYADIYCLPNLSASISESGVLSRVSGSGAETISFSSAEKDVAMTGYEYIDNDNMGHWISMTGENNSFTLNPTNLRGCMLLDKVDFLVKCDGTFSLSNIQIHYKASRFKPSGFRIPQPEFKTNMWNSNTELIPSPTFGNPNTTQTNWSDNSGNAVVSSGNYELNVLKRTGYFPTGTQSIIKISDTVNINTVVPQSSLVKYGKAWLEIWARNFGDWTDSSTSAPTITEDSYDFNELIVNVGNPATKYKTEMRDNVGLSWKVCRFPIDIVPPATESFTALYLRIGAEKSGMEICKVSLKME